MIKSYPKLWNSNNKKYSGIGSKLLDSTYDFKNSLMNMRPSKFAVQTDPDNKCALVLL